MFHLHRNQFRAFGGGNNNIHGLDVHPTNNKKATTYEDIIDNMIGQESVIKIKKERKTKKEMEPDLSVEIEDDTLNFGKEYSVGLM